ncbi:MAG: Hsp70 family protein [Polyangiales bacterium]
MPAPAVGIDLGTTNSVVAVSIGGRPQVLIDSNTGSTLIPSVVSFPESGEWVVGRAARLCRAQDPKNTVYSVKRLLGRPFKSEEVRRARSRVAFDLKEGPDSSVLVGTRAGEMSLPELSAYVLREVRRVAEAALRDKLEKCVVTVPANFNELQRSSTKVAGRIAELEVVRILNEPTAAALAYGYGRGTREKICIFDFGGGTFDVTLLELSGNVFEVLATAGDTFLGGDDIDIAITDSLVVPFQRATKIDPLQDRVVYDVLRDAAETAKCQLSTQDNTRISVEYTPPNGAPLRFQQQLSRADLERLAAPFISRTFDVCSDALKLAGLRPTDLTSVILVGGSTRIPSVRQRVASFFSRDPLTNLPPEEVVAMGASILAEALTGGTRRAPSTKSMNERASTIPPQQAPLPPSQNRPAAAGLPGGAGGASPRQTLSGVTPDSSTPGVRMDSVSGAKLVGEETMITDSPLVPPTPSADHGTRRFGAVDLDDPFAAPGAPQRAPAARSDGRPSSRTLELDEPSFMGRIRKPGAPVEDATREHSVPAFNLDDPSVVAPMPTAVRSNQPAKGPALSEESFAKLPPSIAAAISPPPPRKTEHSVPSFQLDEAVLIGGDNASSPGARVREVSVPSFKIDTDDIFGAGGAEATMIGEAPVIPGFDAAEAMTSRPSAREPSMPGARLPEEPTRIIPPAPPPPKDDPTTVFPSVIPPAATMNAQGVVVPPPLSSSGRAPSAPPPVGPNAPVVPPSVFPPPSTAVAAVAIGASVSSTIVAEPPRGLGSVFPPSSPMTNQQSVSKSLPNAPLLLDVTPFSLGVETAGGQCEPVIRRNATIPVEQTRIFATTSDGQVAVVIRIAQGESRRFVDNQNLGELELSGLRPAPRGEVQVAVTFELEADGTLRVRARDNESGRETQTRVTLLTLPSENAQAEAAARARGGASVVAPMPS